MNIRHAVLLGLIAITSPLIASEKTAPQAILDGKKIELARYAKAFIGADNVTLEVAPYKSASGEGAILLIKGVEGDWDGKAINHSVRPAAREGQDYVTQVNGSEWVTLVMRKSYGSASYELNVPGVKDEIQLAPSDGGAQLITPLAILKEYQNQQTKTEK